MNVHVDDLAVDRELDPEIRFAAHVICEMANRTSAFGKYKTDGRQFTAKEELTEAIVRAHFAGRITIGLHTTGTDNMCRWCCWDIDAHDGEREQDNHAIALALVQRLDALGYVGIVEDSDGRGGRHVWVFFERPIPAADAYHFAREMAPDGVEAFPKQAAINPTPGEPGHFGNWVRLPGKHHKRAHWTRVWSGSRWINWPDAAEIFIDPPLSPAPPPAPKPTRPEVGMTKRGEGTEPLAIRSETDADDWRTLHRCLALIASHRCDGYDPWLRVGMVIHSVDPGQRGLEAWESWSRGSSQFEEGVCATKWKSFGGAHAKPVGIGTLMHWAAEDAGGTERRHENHKQSNRRRFRCGTT